MNQRPQPDDFIGPSAMTKAMWRILPLILLAYVVASSLSPPLQHLESHHSGAFLNSGTLQHV